MKTPIYEIQGGRETGNRIFVRREDLIPFYQGGNKVRIAEAFFRDMKEKGCDAMVAYGGETSNLCRVIASRCYQENIPCRVICSHMPDENRSEKLLSQKFNSIYGTKYLHCSKNSIAECVDQAIECFKIEGYSPYYIYGTRLGTGNEGVAATAYYRAYEDIIDMKEIGIVPDFVFLASGTGATQGGLICGNISSGKNLSIIGISVSRDKKRGTEILKRSVRECLALNHVDASDEIIDKAVHLEDAYVHGGYGQYDNKILDIVRRELLIDSLPLDPVYTGKAFLGMIDYLKDHNITGKNIIFLHTGGTPLFYDCLYSGKLDI